jgi:hypothetical protein
MLATAATQVAAVLLRRGTASGGTLVCPAFCDPCDLFILRPWLGNVPCSNLRNCTTLFIWAAALKPE